MLDELGESQGQTTGGRDAAADLLERSSCRYRRPRPRFAAQVDLHGSKATYFQAADCAPQIHGAVDMHKNRTWLQCWRGETTQRRTQRSDLTKTTFQARIAQKKKKAGMRSC